MEQFDLNLGFCGVVPPAPEPAPSGSVQLTLEAWVEVCKTIHAQGERLDLLTRALAELTRRLTPAAEATISPVHAE